MAEIKWVEIDPDDPVLRPVYGPPCPGPGTHSWRLTIEEGQIGLHSGCDECDEGVMSACGGEDVNMRGALIGALVGRVERFGWPPEYDYWWEFLPHAVEPGRG